MQEEGDDLDHVVRHVLRGGGGELGAGTQDVGRPGDFRMRLRLERTQVPSKKNDPLTAGPRLEQPHSKLEVDARRRTQAEGDDRCKAFGGGHGTDAGYKSRCSGFRTGSVPRCFARCEAGS